MSNKSFILRAFNTNFFEFIDRVITYFPDHTEFQTAKTNMELLKKANPTIIIKIWLSNVYMPYAEEINSGNINFFIHKDYSDDLKDATESSRIMGFINDMREYVMNMPDEPKHIIMTYVQNLSKLSMQYVV